MTKGKSVSELKSNNAAKWIASEKERYFNLFARGLLALRLMSSLPWLPQNLPGGTMNDFINGLH
jgi:hypothetical protein